MTVDVMLCRCIITGLSIGLCSTKTYVNDFICMWLGLLIHPIVNRLLLLPLLEKLQLLLGGQLNKRDLCAAKFLSLQDC